MLNQLKLILELEFSSLGSVRKKGFKSGPGLMCMTQTKYLTHRLLYKRRIEKTEESLTRSQPRDVGRIHLGGAVRTSNLWRRS